MPTNNDRCAVCNHAQAAEIDALLERKAYTHEVLGQRFGVSRYSIMRHNHKHLGYQAMPTATATHIPESPPPPRRLIVVPQPEPEPEPKPEPEKPKTLAEKKEIFVDHMAETGSQIKSMRAASINWFELRRWHEDDEQFHFQFNLAVEHAKDALVDLARDRAIHGTRQVLQVYRKKQLVEERIEYKPSDATLLALLKAYKPELFGDKLAITQTTVVKAIDAMAWEAV